jgi:hypothetical protein
MSVTDLIALIAGIAGVITAIGGILLAIRTVRSKERKAAKTDLDTVNLMLADERRLRIEAERHNYELLLDLAEHGIKPPKLNGGEEDETDPKDLQ